MKKLSGVIILILVSLIWVSHGFAAEIENINIHGFVSQGFLQSDRNNYLGKTEKGSTQFQEFGINFSTNVSDKLRVGMQFFAYDLGEMGNNEPTLDWAYGDYRFKDWLGLRAGRMRRPLGLYNESRDIDLARTFILLPQSIYAENNRNLYAVLDGGGLYGSIPLSSLGELSYLVQMGDYGTKELKFSSFQTDNLEADHAYVGQLQWQTPVTGLRLLGYAHWVSTMDFDSYFLVNGNNTLLHFKFRDGSTRTASLEYTYGDMVIATEYMVRYMHVTMLIPITGPVIMPEFKTASEGYYGSISYQFTKWLQMGAYYSIFYTDKYDRKGKRWVELGRKDYIMWMKDAALTARFDLSENWVAKLEGHIIDGTGLVNEAENPNGTDRHWFLGAAKMTFSF